MHDITGYVKAQPEAPLGSATVEGVLTKLHNEVSVNSKRPPDRVTLQSAGDYSLVGEERVVLAEWRRRQCGVRADMGTDKGPLITDQQIHAGLWIPINGRGP
ncbi:unnamed protein product [Lota lota]